MVPAFWEYRTETGVGGQPGPPEGPTWLFPGPTHLPISMNNVRGKWNLVECLTQSAPLTDPRTACHEDHTVTEPEPQRRSALG